MRAQGLLEVFFVVFLGGGEGGLDVWFHLVSFLIEDDFGLTRLHAAFVGVWHL